MNISGIKLLAGLTMALLLGSILAASVFAASPTPPTQSGTGGYYEMMGGYNLNAAAKLLGVTRAELVTQLQQGKTLAQLAQDKGVDATKLVDTLIAPGKDELQLRVKYGYITQDQADAEAQALTDRANTAINTPWGNNGYGSSGEMWGNGFGDMMGEFGNMMSGFGGMMNGLGGMMGGLGSSFGGFGGMMGGNGSGGMMGGWNR